MKTSGFAVRSVDEFSQQLHDSLKDDFKPTLAIAFGASTFPIEGAAAHLSERDIDLFSCTTAGEIYVDNDKDHSVQNDSFSCLLLEMPRELYAVHLFPITGTCTEVGKEGFAWAKTKFSNPAMILLASGLDTNGEEIVHAILDAAKGPVQLCGALAGDDFKSTATFVHTNNNASQKGLLVLAFDGDKVRLDSVAANGWEEIGAFKTVTESVGNLVKTLDGVPILDVYREYLGDECLTDLAITAEYPLQLHREDGTKVMRAVIHQHQDTGAITFAGTVPQGVKVKFVSSPGSEILGNAVDEMTTFHQTHESADFLLFISCASRLLALGTMVADEITPTQKLWGAPMVGLFSYGEVGALRGGDCDFHNQTCVLATVKVL